MTFEIGLVLAILAVSIILFITEIVAMDVVALLVLGVLAVTGLVTPAEALSGFSNPAVVTVWAMFILSAGLSRTGVANLISQRVLKLAGRGEGRMIIVIMLTAGGLSALMNNIGVAALMLPVVMDMARRTHISPSKLLMPLAYASLLGGLTTLIGTPPNLLVSEALRNRDLAPFQLFDFTPIGGCVMLGGVAFIALLGRHLLPVRDTTQESSNRGQRSLREHYALHERTFVMRLPPNSVLVNKTLAQTRLGSALGLTVYAVIRRNKTQLAPDPQTELKSDDRLLVGGRLDKLFQLRNWRELKIEKENFSLETLISNEIELAEVRLSPDSSLAGRALFQTDFRQKFGLNILAIRSNSTIKRTNLPGIMLQPGDRLLVQGKRERLQPCNESDDFDEYRPVSKNELTDFYRLQERIFAVSVARESVLVGEKLVESRLGDAFGLQVLAIIRQGVTQLMPDSEEKLQASDWLLVKGRPEDLDVLRGLQQLEIESKVPPELSDLESHEVGLIEVTLSPQTRLVGKTLRQLNFRDKYGLQVLAIWREGKPYRSNLRNLELRFGDALLILGRRENLMILAREPDLLVLTETVQQPPKTKKAPMATAIMAAVITPVLFGWLPISIAAVVGATLIVLTGCMSMEEAYRSIEWRPIFLIAGMLPLGIAMQQTGAASLLAESMVAIAGPMGPWTVILGLYLITALATTIVPTAALVVLMAPIVIKTATDMGISPHAGMMAIAMAASASFTSPISHPANILVMGPGGYRFIDYVKLGAPLALVVLIVVMIVLPIFWPLYP
ncbi:SLC13 family permease [bacterium]|nr:SLC13 family permease [bacterium]